MKFKLLTPIIIIGFSFSNLTEAQFKQFQNPLGAITGNSSESSGDISSIQDNLLADLTDALGDVLAAQAIIAKAQGNQELAATLDNTSKKMKLLLLNKM
jgi:hypothetical protein